MVRKTFTPERIINIILGDSDKKVSFLLTPSRFDSNMKEEVWKS